MAQTKADIRAFYWRDDTLHILDQRRLPALETWLILDSAAQVVDAIRDMCVRGAPAIGIVAAYGVVLSARTQTGKPMALQQRAILADMDSLAQARPTAVNLRWALQRMRYILEQHSPPSVAALLAEARAIHRQDIEQNQRMAAAGSALIVPESVVLTHCNTGSLATGAHGTALGVIRNAWRAGSIRRIFATETRPWLQGARLTAWELARDGIPATLIIDAAAAVTMQREHVGWIIVGADRIAANGDVANKIGTYALAVMARHHGARFMVVAPSSSVDMRIPDGGHIPIEYRDHEEIWKAAGLESPLPGIDARNPAFDITPAELVDMLVTERGIIEKPGRENMAKMFENVG